MCRRRRKKGDPEEPDDHALGRSRGGFSTKVHLICDAGGCPIHFELSAGQAHENTSLIELLNGVSQDPLVVLLLLHVLMLLLGTFMDMGPMIIITTPIFLPVVVHYGIDPVHFGVILILNLGIGLNTPPVGTVQFVACAVGKISVWQSMRSIWPFYAAGLIVLGLVTYIPALSLWLPHLFRGI